MLSSAQLVVAVAVTGYLLFERIRLSYRNQQSWESLVANLSGGSPRPEPSAGVIRSRSELWALYKRAGAMAAIADYAHWNGCENSRTILSIRSDALAIRFSVWKRMLARMHR